MSNSGLPFVPRKVAKLSKQHTSPHISSCASSYVPPVQPLPVTDRPRNLPSDEDLCALVRLALSDYAIWTEPELLRTLVTHRESSSEGYISLFHLLSNSSVFAGLALHEHESLVGKALRKHASEDIQTRLVVVASSVQANNFGWPLSNQGLYEVRRSNLNPNIQTYTRDDWVAKTLYMENFPPTVKSIAHIFAFVVSLLGQSATSNIVEHVHLPKHHADKPSYVAQFKGFALVTLSSIAFADQIHETWPWDVRPMPALTDGTVREANKFGFRTLRRKRWEELNEEYLSYQAQLLDHNAEATSHHKAPVVVPTSATPRVHKDALFPERCLVFVKNIHLETNKTTLRTFFGTIGGDPGISYLDLRKGTGTCYLRFRTPNHAAALVQYFKEKKLTQPESLSTTPLAGTKDTIVAEMVLGTAEEVYWSKVPDKLRQEAVKAALKDE